MASAGQGTRPNARILDILNDSDEENEQEFLGFEDSEVVDTGSDDEDAPLIELVAEQRQNRANLATEEDVDDLAEGWEEGTRKGKPFTFTGKPEIKSPLPENPKPIDFFNIFINDDDFSDIANETNR